MIKEVYTLITNFVIGLWWYLEINTACEPLGFKQVL